MPAIWLAGGAALGAGGSIFSGIMGASGASKQASAIRYAADKASSTALELNTRSRADLAPYNTAGQSATGTLMDLLNGTSDVIAKVHESPLYQFESEIGTRDINRQLTQRGLYNSGKGLETLANFTKGLVGIEANNYYTRLFGISQLGENAAAQTASNTTQTGTAVAGIQAQAGARAGQATASQYANYGNIGTGVANAFRGYVGDTLSYQLYNKIFGIDTSGGTSAPGVNPGTVNIRQPGNQPSLLDVATFN